MKEVSSVLIVILLWARNIFIVTKCVVFIVKSLVVSAKYKETYETWNQFEIWFFVFGAVKILCLAPNIWFTEINYFYFMFATNSF